MNNWNYNTAEDIPLESEAAPPAESDIIPPPREDLQALYELTMFGNLRRVREKADAIAQQDAQYRAFARAICRHAEKLEDEPILDMVKMFLEQG